MTFFSFLFFYVCRFSWGYDHFLSFSDTHVISIFSYVIDFLLFFLSNILYFPGHCEYYIGLWVIFKFCGSCLYFCLGKLIEVDYFWALGQSLPSLCGFNVTFVEESVVLYVVCRLWMCHM